MSEIAKAKLVLDIHKSLFNRLNIEHTVQNKYYNKAVKSYIESSNFPVIQHIDQQSF